VLEVYGDVQERFYARRRRAADGPAAADPRPLD
jgi:hypothetical protein